MNALVLKDHFLRIAESDVEFPIDFDDAWQWIGFSRKDPALRTLKNNFEEGFDFSTSKWKSTGGRPTIHYQLAIDCFKSLCMMAHTDTGKEVRKYYLQGVNKIWLKTGQGKMFDGKKIDSQLEEMNILFNQLNPHFKRYLLTQIKNLARLQNAKDME